MSVTVPVAPGGIKSYYQAKIEAAEITINRKTQNLRRLEAQRNALNARGVSLYYPLELTYANACVTTQYDYCAKSFSFSMSLGAMWAKL
jgi:hypothetical protein